MIRLSKNKTCRASISLVAYRGRLMHCTKNKVLGKHNKDDWSAKRWVHRVGPQLCSLAISALLYICGRYSGTRCLIWQRPYHPPLSIPTELIIGYTNSAIPCCILSIRHWVNLSGTISQLLILVTSELSFASLKNALANCSSLSHVSRLYYHSPAFQPDTFRIG